MVCCLFGHKDTSSSILPELEAKIRYVIEHEAVDYFLVGNNGTFDSMALRVLRNMVHEYPGITYHAVLAYLPIKQQEGWSYSMTEAIYPEGLESIHPKYAIAWRNKWMVDSSNIVISYVTHNWGGAAKYTDYARKKGKKIINLGSHNK